jgi:hypothetical protein
LARWMRWCGPAAAVAALALAGCANGERPAVERVVSDFEAALAGGDPGSACRLLAPATRDALEYQVSRPCAVALGQTPLPGGGIVDSAVWGGEAQVHTGGDTVFLTRTSRGWLVAAAGCRPQGEAPYQCRLEGP